MNNQYLLRTMLVLLFLLALVALMIINMRVKVTPDVAEPHMKFYYKFDSNETHQIVTITADGKSKTRVYGLGDTVTITGTDFNDTYKGEK